jgi:hypothetical protein
MKKIILPLAIAVMFVIAAVANAAGKYSACTTVQDNVLTTSDGYPIGPGFDDWGYNYGAFKFQSIYCDAYHQAAWCQGYNEVYLAMQWNDAWISSRDCDNDGALDRHRGYASYRGSGAWLTNHMWGDDGDGIWVYFTKIVAAPLDATAIGGVWYDASGKEIGPVIWGEFAILLEMESGAAHQGRAILYKSPSGPGFGKF